MKRGVRLSLTVGALIMLAVSGCASTHRNDSQAVNRSGLRAVNHLSPLPDMALTPSDWSPVALGAVQVSVPSSWFIEYQEVSCGGGLQGKVFIDQQPAVGSPCSLAPNVVALYPSSAAPVPHSISTVFNSIPVTFGWSQIGSVKTHIIRALGYDITASGPLAEQVLHTLTHSPLSVVLNSQVAGTPPGWRPVTFGGMRFSVPATWTATSFSWWGGCPGNLDPSSLWLSTAETVAAPGCSFPAATAESNAGVPAMVVGSGPQISAVGADGVCSDHNGLRICIDPPPNPNGGFQPGHEASILTAQVYVPGQRYLDQIEIGLSGDGTTALKVFDSIRPAA